MVLRQSIKIIKLSYILCLVLAVGIGVYLTVAMDRPEHSEWTLAVPAVLLFLTAVRHANRRMVRLEILGDRLRYQAGFLSKTTRTIELLKVQDVRVDQTLAQRMLGVGNLSLETAGMGSAIVMPSIDNPQTAADHILGLAKAQRAHPSQGAGPAQGAGPEGAGQAGGV
jgi:membrane protein YdbS with pleckstrin-like domain